MYNFRDVALLAFEKEIWKSVNLGICKLEIWEPGNLELWKYGTWTSGNLGSNKQKTKVPNMEIRVAQNVGKVWISRKKSFWPHSGPSGPICCVGRKKCKKCVPKYFLTCSCRFLHHNYLFKFEFFQCIYTVQAPSKNFKKHSISKIVLTFHYSNK